MYGDQTYDSSNPFGFSSNGEDLSSLMGDQSSTSSDPWAALDQWYQQNQGNP
jgi:hypothetical protein